MTTIQEKIAIMQAFADGKKIEGRSRSNQTWREIKEPSWNWIEAEFRVKKEPRTFYLTSYSGNNIGGCYKDKATAKRMVDTSGEIIKVVEVSED